MNHLFLKIQCNVSQEPKAVPSRDINYWRIHSSLQQKSNYSKNKAKLNEDTWSHYVLVSDTPLKTNGTRAKLNQNLFWDHVTLAYLHLVPHLMMSQRLRPLLTRAKCPVSDKRFGTTCLIAKRWSRARILEGKSSLEGLARKGLLESHLTC